MQTFSLRQVVIVVLIAFLTSIVGVSLYEQLMRPRANQLTAARSNQDSAVELSDVSVVSDEINNVEVYREMSPGVVHITRTVDVQHGFWGVYPQQGTGSGSIIDNQGHILTNFHVVRNARRIDVTLANKSNYKASVVGIDPQNDIAVIKIDAPADKLNIIPLGTSKDLVVGEKVLAIGNPFGLDRTLTTGVISGLGRPLETDDGRVIENVIQTDASINPGNSGGPLLDKYGNMIGVNTAIFSPSGGSVGIGFAIPIDIVKSIIPELIAQGRVRRGYLGVSMVPLTPAIAQEFNINVNEGVIVVRVLPDSAADNAGLRGLPNSKEIGDIVISVDGKPVKDSGELANIISNHKPGDKLTFGVLRDGKQIQLTVTLDEQPVTEESVRRRSIFDWRN